MPRRELRSNIGMVLQDTWLFGGTIRDNIAYGNLDATEEQILRGGAGHLRRPLRALAARRLRHDASTTRAATSAPARSSCSPSPGRSSPTPTILILDEATSSVDTRTEVLIQQAMAALRSQPHQLRDRPPAVDDPRRRHHPRDGRRPASSSRATTTSCSRPAAPTTTSTTRSSPPRPPRSPDGGAPARAAYHCPPEPSVGWRSAGQGTEGPAGQAPGSA